MTSNLCSQILSEKYGQWEKTRIHSRQVVSSATWRGVLSNMDLLRYGIRWRIGNGSQVSVWHDRWLDEEALESVAVSGILEHELSQPVRTYWDPASGWRWELLHPKLPSDILA